MRFAPGGVKTFGKGAVGDHRRNFEAEPALPVFAASRAQYGFKVAASAGNQDDDVLHDVIEKKCIDAVRYLLEIECAREADILNVRRFLRSLDASVLCFAARVNHRCSANAVTRAI